MSDKSRLENNNINISNMINITNELNMKINNLPEIVDTSDATATSSDISAGKIAYGSNKLIGNLTEIASSNFHTIPFYSFEPNITDLTFLGQESINTILRSRFIYSNIY